MKKTFLQLFAALALLASFTACQPASNPSEGEEATQEPAEDPRLDFTIIPGERVGLITTDQASKEAVLAAYGDLAKADSVHLSEGFFGPGVILFPEDERNRVDIYWETEIDPERPAFIRILGAEGQTDWTTKQGITIGSSLEMVEQLNDAPFQLYGFGWDYGGYVADWKDGQMTNNLSLRFDPTAEETPMELVGDQMLSSDFPALREAKPVVSELSISFPRSNLLPLMQGEWQSIDDAGYQIRIEDSQIAHYTNNRLMYSATIEADPGCQSDACSFYDANAEGFCFLEKGEHDVQCNMVLTCDGQRLEYAAVGSTGATLTFEKIN